MTKKFRAWSDYHKKFVVQGAEFGLQRLFEDFSVSLMGKWQRNEDYEMPFRIADYKIQQWTGLTDSQGVEIYEGDIVSTIYPEYKTAKVFFCINSGSFRLLSGNVALPMVTMRTQGGQSPKLINVFEKVIGNIFQNHELLEKC